LEARQPEGGRHCLISICRGKPEAAIPQLRFLNPKTRTAHAR
jgi:hypothetical protein